MIPGTNGDGTSIASFLDKRLPSYRKIPETYNSFARFILQWEDSSSIVLGNKITLCRNSNTQAHTHIYTYMCVYMYTYILCTPGSPEWILYLRVLQPKCLKFKYPQLLRHFHRLPKLQRIVVTSKCWGVFTIIHGIKPRTLESLSPKSKSPTSQMTRSMRLSYLRLDLINLL
jgi:hypothetical protein